MTAQIALQFHSLEELYAALRQCNRAEAWRAPAAVWRLRGPQGETVWLLQVSFWSPAMAVWTLKKADEREVVLEGGEGLETFAVEERWEAASLFEAVRLEPWPYPPAGEVLYLWLPRERWAEVIRSNLLLGNDQMQFVPIKPDRVLLRVVGLSPFLREKWRQDPDLGLFYPAGDEHVLLPWGFTYPLREKFSFLSAAEGERWLVTPDHRWWHLPPAQLRDVYEVLRVNELNLQVAELQPGEAMEPVAIDLQLEETETTERPQVWRLTEREREALEELLAQAPEEELDRLQVAYLQTAAGERFYLVVERSPTGIAPYLRAGRAYFARYPEEHLYLPVGTRLRPPLGRRACIEAFALREEVLTLVERGKEGGLQVWRVPRSALRPLREIVDYFLGEMVEEVRALERQIIFEFEQEPAGPEEEQIAPTRRLPWWKWLRWLWTWPQRWGRKRR
ncbi:MAG TPA: hypothetical protein EYP85_03670 [Armatimonadetes bacterium]|nr:hypothetical protein [Armatimonadota bacterium]